MLGGGAVNVERGPHPELPCFICGEHIGSEPSGALVFTAGGNYGSTVFDPIVSSPGEILIFIHDTCVTERISRATCQRVSRVATVSYRQLSYQEGIGIDVCGPEPTQETP